MALSNPFNPPPNTPIVKQDALTDSIWRRWFEQIWKRVQTGSLGGTVTSVGLSMPTSVFDVANSPVTTAGTIAVTFDNQSANTVFAGPTTGSPATPSFRALVTSDLPAGTGTVTSVDVSGGTTGLTTSGGPITTSGTITIAGTLVTANGGTGQSSYTNGQLLIGNTTGNTLSKATLTAGTGISVTNGAGSITIAATNNGDVVGPVSATDNAIALFDTGSGKLLKDSATLLSALMAYSDTRYKFGTFTRDLSIATGTQSITGVGFEPKAVIFGSGLSGSAVGSCVGVGSPSANYGFQFTNAASPYFLATTFSIYIAPSTLGSYQVGSISSVGSDGFTVSWTKVGTPTGTATVWYLALR